MAAEHDDVESLTQKPRRVTFVAGSADNDSKLPDAFERALLQTPTAVPTAPPPPRTRGVVIVPPKHIYRPTHTMRISQNLGQPFPITKLGGGAAKSSNNNAPAPAPAAASAPTPSRQSRALRSSTSLPQIPSPNSLNRQGNRIGVPEAIVPGHARRSAAERARGLRSRRPPQALPFGLLTPSERRVMLTEKARASEARRAELGRRVAVSERLAQQLADREEAEREETLLVRRMSEARRQRQQLRRRRRERRQRLRGMTRWQQLEDRESRERAWLDKRGKSSALDFTRGQRRQLRAWFDDMDTGDSGEIDTAELVDPLLSIGIARTANEVERMVRRVDVDGSGTISFAEFLTLLAPSKHSSSTATADGSGGGGGSDADATTAALAEAALKNKEGGSGGAPSEKISGKALRSAAAAAAAAAAEEAAESAAMRRLQASLSNEKVSLSLPLIIGFSRRSLILEAIMGDSADDDAIARATRDEADALGAGDANKVALARNKRRQCVRRQNQRASQLNALVRVVDEVATELHSDGDSDSSCASGASGGSGGSGGRRRKGTGRGSSSSKEHDPKASVVDRTAATARRRRRQRRAKRRRQQRAKAGRARQLRSIAESTGQRLSDLVAKEEETEAWDRRLAAMEAEGREAAPTVAAKAQAAAASAFAAAAAEARARHSRGGGGGSGGSGGAGGSGNGDGDGDGGHSGRRLGSVARRGLVGSGSGGGGGGSTSSLHMHARLAGTRSLDGNQSRSTPALLRLRARAPSGVPIPLSLHDRAPTPLSFKLMTTVAPISYHTRNADAAERQRHQLKRKPLPLHPLTTQQTQPTQEQQQPQQTKEAAEGEEEGGSASATAAAATSAAAAAASAAASVSARALAAIAAPPPPATAATDATGAASATATAAPNVKQGRVVTSSSRVVTASSRRAPSSSASRHLFTAGGFGFGAADVDSESERGDTPAVLRQHQHAATPDAAAAAADASGGGGRDSTTATAAAAAAAASHRRRLRGGGGGRASEDGAGTGADESSRQQQGLWHSQPSQRGRGVSVLGAPAPALRLPAAAAAAAAASAAAAATGGSGGERSASAASGGEAQREAMFGLPQSSL